MKTQRKANSTVGAGIAVAAFLFFVFGTFVYTTFPVWWNMWHGGIAIEDMGMSKEEQIEQYKYAWLEGYAAAKEKYLDETDKVGL